MRVLLDHNVNPRFARSLPQHDVSSTLELGWQELQNGQLISAAENAGFDAIITADKKMRFQQSLGERKISVIVLNSLLITLRHIQPLAPEVNSVLNSLEPGTFIIVEPDRSNL